MAMNQSGENGTEANGTARASRSPLAMLKGLGSLPRKVQAQAHENPTAALIAVGAAAFVLGGLVGSRVGRFALAASIPVVVSRVLDGTVARELARLAAAMEEPRPS